MTVEDPRFVASDSGQDDAESIGNTTNSQDEPIVVAQADGEPASTTEDPADPVGAIVVIPSEIVPDADNVVRLPAGVTIDAIRIDGADIVLVQEDGTEIRILNAALNIPTFVIGGIEIPQEALVAALGENGINVAAGPDGQLSVTGSGSPGSGANFTDLTNEGIGEVGPDVLGLLQGTQSDGDGGDGDEPVDSSNVAPAVSAGGDTGTLTETADVVGGTDADPLPATGTLSFSDPNFGQTHTASVPGQSVTTTNLNNGLTLSAAQTATLLAGFALDSAGGVTSEPTAAADGTVDWTYALDNDAVDFLAAGESVVLTFDVTIADGALTGVATVTVTVFGTNDGPVVSVEAGDLADVTLTESSSDPLKADGTLTFDDVDTSDNNHAVTGTAVAASGETAQLAATNAELLAFFDAAVATQSGATGTEGSIAWTFSAPDNNFDFLREGQELDLTYTITLTDDAGATTTQDVVIRVIGTNDLPVIETADPLAVDEELLPDGNDGDSYPAGDLVPNGALSSGGSLNITWGPDDYTDITQTTVDGDVVFTNVVNVSTGQPLTSRGEDVTTALSNGGATITGTAGGRTVFIATVDEQGNGTYSFQLVDVLDHPTGVEEDDIALNFEINVIDSDNAVQAHSFDVTIDDDAPEIASVESTGIVHNSANPVAVTGDIDIAYGADGVAATDNLRITDWPTIPGIATVLSPDGLTLEATHNGNPLYTLVLDPKAATDGYTFTLHQAWPVSTETISVTSDQFPDGNSGNYAFEGVTFTGINPFEFSLLAPAGGFGVGASGGIFGNVDNNFISDGESFGMDFAELMDSVTLDLSVIADIDLGFSTIDGTLTVNWTASNSTTSENGSFVYSSNDDFNPNIDPSIDFDNLGISIDTSGALGLGSVQVTGLSGETVPLPPDFEDLQFQITATDGDGDPVTGDVDVTLVPGVLLYDGDPGAGGTLLNSYATIQAAIDDAADGNFVVVNSGTFEELLSISDKDISLIGQGDSTIIMAPDGAIPTTITVAASSTPDKSAIVTVENATVNIEGIKIDGGGRGNERAQGSDDYNGIVMINSGGTVEDVTITGIRAPLDGNGNVSGGQWGVGFYIYNVDGTPRTLNFTGNTIEDFQKNATVFAGQGLDVTVTDNAITGNGGTPTTAQNGLQFSTGVTGTVDSNTVEEIGWFYSGTGIQWTSSSILSNGADVDITNNMVTGPSNDPTPPQILSATGIYVISDPDGSVLQSNTVEGFAWGIISYLDGAQPIINGNSFADDLLNLGFYDPAVGVTVNGSDGADEFDGGPGDDTFNGLGGDDSFSWSVGDGNDRIDGGTEGTADTFQATGDAGAAETFIIYTQAKAIAQIGYAGAAEIVVTRNGTIISELTDIEEIAIDGQGGGDTFAVEGDFTGTSLLTSTITFNGGDGSDTVDITGLASGHRVVAEGGAGVDLVNFSSISFASVEGAGVAGIYEGGDLVGLTITSGSATHEFRGFENFQFSDGLKSFNEVLNIPEPGDIEVFDGGGSLVGTFMDLQDAVNATLDGYTVKIGEGTFATGNQSLVIDNEITIIGQSEADTIVQPGTTAWGIYVTADNVSIQHLTVDASSVTHYGIKVNPADTGTPTANLTDFLLENVTVQGAGRSEVDLNGVDNSTLRNVTADGQGTSGVGIALSDSTDITLENIETSGNNWGSIGLYSKGAVWEPGTNDVTFDGTYSHDEPIGIYADEEGVSAVENVDFSGIFPEVYVVRNDTHRDASDGRSDDFTFFFGSEADATAFALAMPDPGDSVITGPFDPSSVDADLGTPLPGGATFIVAEGMSIQEAIDKASDGDTILVKAGTYDESLIIDKEVTLVSADGPGAATISGTLTTNPPFDGSPLDEFFEANNPSYSGTTGVAIRADNITLDGFSITGFDRGVELDGASMDGVSLLNNILTGNVTGLRKGTAAEVTDITVNGNTFSHGVHGMTIYAASNGDGSFDMVTMDGNSFSSLSEKGMYFEQLSHALLAGNNFDDVGNFGRISPPFGGTQGEFGNAIDINLKYGVYEGVTFTDTVITNSGNSDMNGAGEPGAFGGAIAVKIRDDGPSYDGNPASFNGQIVFEGGSIDGTSTGVRVGEPGKDNNGPDVLIDGVLIGNADVSDVENATDPTTGGLTTVVMHPDQGTLDGSASQAPLDVTGSDKADTIIGGSAADAMAGGLGDDVLIGGLGDDALIGGSGLNTVTGDEGADTFVIDPSALTEVGLVDVIADYDKDDGDSIDLGNLLDAAFGAGAPTDDAAADAVVHLRASGGNTEVVVDTNGADPDGEIVVAELAGVHTAINILFDGGNDADVS